MSNNKGKKVQNLEMIGRSLHVQLVGGDYAQIDYSRIRFEVLPYQEDVILIPHEECEELWSVRSSRMNIERYMTNLGIESPGDIYKVVEPKTTYSP